MTEQGITKNSRPFLIVGIIAVIASFVVYGRFQDPEMVTPDAIDSYIRLSYGFYVILALALGSIAYGLYNYQRQKAVFGKSGILHILSTIAYTKKSQKIFIITFISYGIFFSLTSGTLVYDEQISFSYHYGVKVPSANIIPCCDAPGYMPKIVVYLTDHVGLQIIPINLLLQIIVSYLVALNMAIAVNAIKISKKKRGMSTVGAATGLFIACPTCVGSLLSIFVGTASGIALTIALTQLQTVFIGISIPILLITPFILARRMMNSDGSCVVDFK